MNVIYCCVAVHHTDKLKCWHLLFEYMNALTWLHFPHTENQLKHLHLSFSSSTFPMEEAYILTLIKITLKICITSSCIYYTLHCN